MKTDSFFLLRRLWGSWQIEAIFFCECFIFDWAYNEVEEYLKGMFFFMGEDFE